MCGTRPLATSVAGPVFIYIYIYVKCSLQNPSVAEGAAAGPDRPQLFRGQPAGPEGGGPCSQVAYVPKHLVGDEHKSADAQDPQARRYMSQKYAQLMQRPQAVTSQSESEIRPQKSQRSTEDRNRKTRLGQLASTGLKLPKAEPGPQEPAKRVLQYYEKGISCYTEAEANNGRQKCHNAAAV